MIINLGKCVNLWADGFKSLPKKEMPCSEASLLIFERKMKKYLLFMFLCFRDLRQGGETFLQLFIGRDVIGHIAIIKLLIAFQIEIACSGQTK